MTVTSKYILYQLLIIIPFICGYLLKNSLGDSNRFTKRLINANLMSIEPLIALWSIWGLRLKSDLVFLPIGGLLTVLAGMAIGYIILKFANITGKSRASFLISSTLSNHGYTMGGFICYLFMGEHGLGLSFIFISYFMPFLFLVIFPYAKLASGKGEYRENYLKGFFLNLQNMPFYAIIVALILQFADIKRPDINFPISILLMISIAIYYFSLGVNFKFEGLKGIKRENAYLVLTKFILLPITALLVLGLLDIDGSVKAVILIQSFMPVAIYAVISSILFDLNSKLASGLFVTNTVIFILIVLPMMFLLRYVILNL